MVDLQHAAIKHLLDNGLLRERIIDSNYVYITMKSFIHFESRMNRV